MLVLGMISYHNLVLIILCNETLLDFRFAHDMFLFLFSCFMIKIWEIRPTFVFIFVLEIPNLDYFHVHDNKNGKLFSIECF